MDRARNLLRRRAVVAGAILATCGAGAFVLDLRPGAGAQEQRFESVAVRRGTLEDAVTALGKLQPRAYVDVGAQASWQLLHLHAREGDRVAEGQRLAEIDPSLQEAQVEAGEAEIERLNAQIVELEARARFAAARAERQARLARNQFTSAQENDRAAMEATSAAAQLAMTRAQIRTVAATLRSNRTQLGYTKIDAPMAGTVVSLEARQGQTLVATYQPAQLLRIADLAVMTVWTQVAEADVARIRVGMPVWFTTLGHPEQRRESVVRQILPSPSRSLGGGAPPGGGGAGSGMGNGVVLYTALFDVPNPDGDLRPQMSAQTFFVIARAVNAVIAPVAALGEPDGAPDRVTVRVLGPGGVTTRAVRVGVRTRFEAEILEGLAEGERVVTGEKPEDERSAIRFTP